MKICLFILIVMLIPTFLYAQDKNSLVRIPPAASIHKPIGAGQNIVVDTDITPTTQEATGSAINKRVSPPPTLGPQSAADAKLASDIQSYLVQSNLGGSIYVTSSGGVITLQGSVDSMQKANEAEKIARSFPGVQKVIVNITIQSTGMQ